MRPLLFFAAAICCSRGNILLAQVNENARLMEAYIENSESEADYTDMYEQLEHLLKHPLNLNTADDEALLQIPSMTAARLYALQQHKRRFGSLVSVNELQVVDGFDEESIRCIRDFVSVTEAFPWSAITVPKLLHEGNSELLLLGARNYGVAGEPAHTGSPYKLSMRYRYSFNNRLFFNYAGEKDAGETFFRANNKNGFDFNSASLALKHSGFVKTLVLGDYRCAFGQGLTFASGMAAGKSASVLTVQRSGQGLNPYRAMNENEFLRGIGFTLGFKKLAATFFASNKRIDASLAAPDSLSQAEFSSLTSSGYHRTAAEISKQNTISRFIAGTNITFNTKHIHLGFTFARTAFSASPARSEDLYKLFDASGNKILNAGIDHRFIWRNLVFFGEISCNGDKQSLSRLTGLLVSLHKSLDLCILNRSYSRYYTPVMSNAFAESGNRNESGTYISIVFSPKPEWKLSAYYDVFSAPWLKYRVNAPSRGNDMLVELRCQKRKSYSCYFRFKNENKLYNSSDDVPLRVLVPQNRQSCRFHADVPLSKTFSISSRAEQVWFHSGKQQHSGVLIFQDISWSHKKVRVAARVALYATDDYNARIYMYEDDVLYAFSTAMLQSKGCRIYTVLKYRVSRSADLWLKLARSNSYTDLTTRNDVKVQLRIKF